MKSYGYTDVGLKREINQDSYTILESGNIGLYVVADGMGGHSHGELASAKLVSDLTDYWEECKKEGFSGSFPDLVDGISAAAEESNRRIFHLYNRDAICGTTLVVLLIYEDYFAVFSVGDSRIYTKKGLKLTQLTFDDIWDNQPEVKEKLSQQEIRENANHGKLMHAVGIRESINVHVNTGQWVKNQKFIVCSDGVYKYCNEKKMKKIFFSDCGKNDFETIGKKLTEEVMNNGAKDNLTFILIAPGN